MFNRMPEVVRGHIIQTLGRFGTENWEEVFSPYSPLEIAWIEWRQAEIVLNQNNIFGETLQSVASLAANGFPDGGGKLLEALRGTFDSYLEHVRKESALPGGALVCLAVDGKYKLLSGHMRVAAAFRCGLMSIRCEAWVGEMPAKREQSKVILNAIQQSQKKMAELRHTCMYPGCYAEAIDSHSQQHHGQLSVLARDGSVYAIDRNHLKQLGAILMRGEDPRPRITLQKIKNVSVYPGFCNKHDTKVFDDIERRVLTKGDKDQVLAFHIRGLSYTNARQNIEWVQARQGYQRLQDLLGINIENPQLVNWSIYVPADKRLLIDPCFKKGAKRELRYVWRIINKNIGVSCASSVTLFEDEAADAYVGEATDYKKMRLLRPRPLASLNVVPKDDCTHIIVAWHKRINSLVREFVTKLTSDDIAVFQESLNDVIFNRSEDYVLSPALWDSLSEELREACERAIVPEHIRGRLESIPRVIDLTGCRVE